MNQAHLHLVFNHLPIIVPMVGALVMIGGFIIRSETVKLTALAIFVLGALCTIPAGATGEGAEEVVEHLQGVSHQLIHEHEEKAEVFAISSYILGVVSLLGLWANWKKKSFANYIPMVVLVLSFVAMFLGKQTGTSGGEIRHSEIREGGASQTNEMPAGNKAEHDDD